MTRSTIVAWLSAILMIAAATQPFTATAVQPKHGAAPAALATPDFSYPATVVKDNNACLAEALASGSEKEALRALMNIEIASVIVDAESVDSVLKVSRAVIDRFTDDATRTLGKLFLASACNDFYRSNRYVYDRRSIPLRPYPDQISLWSGEQFRDTIFSLVREAVGPRERLFATPLRDWDLLVSIPEGSAVYYPSLYDFVATKSISIVSGLSEIRQILPVARFSQVNIFVGTPVFSAASPEADFILSTYAGLLRHYADTPAPFVNYDLERIGFTANHLFAGSDTNADSLRIDLLRDLYNRTSGSEFSGDVLLRIGERAEIGSETSRWLLEKTERNIRQFPAYAGITPLKNLAETLRARSAEISSTSVVYPGVPFEVECQTTNLPAVTLKVYDVTKITGESSRESVRLSRLSSMNPVSTIEVRGSANPGVYPYKDSMTGMVTIAKVGRYVIVPSYFGDEDSVRDDYCQVIHCTTLQTIIESLDGSVAIVVDPRTGEPVSGAELRTFYDLKNPRRFGTTGKDGMLKLPEVNSGMSVGAVKGDDLYSTAFWYGPGYDTKTDKEHIVVEPMTDLSIYHPGDTVEVCAVVYTLEHGNRRHVRDGFDLRLTVTSPNWTDVGKISGITDHFGRMTARFVVPNDQLTGTYHIGGTNPDPRNYRLEIMNTNFEVSDYKLPEFAVILDKPVMDIPEKGSVTVNGSVRTYSGFPLSDSEITLSLSVSQAPWWGNSVEFATLKSTTDADGRFSIVLTPDLLNASPCPNGFYRVTAEATSVSGETQNATTSFSRAPAFKISADIPYEIDASVDGGVLKAGMSILDAEANSVSRQIRLLFINRRDEKDTISFVVTTPDPVIDLSAVPSGSYRLKIEAVGFDATPVTRYLTIYRPTDITTPNGDVIWVPGSVHNFSGDSVEMLYAAADDDTHILVTVYARDHVISRRWINSTAGMHRFKTKVPEDVDELSVNMVAYKQMNSNILKSSFKRDCSINRLVIERESFRDRIVPGSEETWRFSFRVENRVAGSSPTEAAVILNLYNKALDAVAPYSINLNEVLDDWNSLHVTKYYVNPVSIIVSDRRPGFGFVVQPPFWMTKGQDFYSYILYQRRMYKSANNLTAVNSMNVGDMGSDDIISADEHKEEVMAEAVSSCAGAAMFEDASADQIIARQQQEAERNSQDESFSYRESEVTSAFFRPMLTTDADGNLEFSFTAPNANTTWMMRMLAYTSDILTAYDNAEILASKPVMVAPNLPRFVRLGDRAEVSAIVMNNSDSTLSVKTLIEIFNPADGAIIARREVDHTLEASSSAVASIAIDCSFGPLIGYRVKSSTGRFSDGEQALIAVLPASEPVIESKPFYLVPDSTEFEMTLPQMPEDATVTLQFCENPVWFVVTALPGLTAGEPSTPSEAASAIYAAAIADNLLRLHPEIARALRLWSESDRSEGMLKSMLSKNEELKTVLLSATPWMLNAKNDTERMSRLSLMFDKHNIRRVYDRSISTLEKLEADGGGWRWISHVQEPSLWVTTGALSLFAHLERLGYKPSDKKLSEMIVRAVAYVDGEQEKIYRKSPDSDFLGYSFVRTAFAEPARSTAVKQIIASTVTSVIKNWKSYTLFDKGVGAILLNANGHPAMARQIMESVDQFSRTTPAEGMYWPSLNNTWYQSYNDLGITALLLEAYEATGAPADKLDRIRQWLILQKETRDWGSSAPTSTVIADILGSSSRWIAPAEGAVVTLGGREVAPGEIERYTGSFSADISSMDPSGAELRISKTGDLPAWGAVICRYDAVMETVEAVSCKDLAIEKHLYRAVQTDKGTRWETARDLRVGDRVKIELVIRVGRRMDYVAITDNRAAALEPVEQLPAPIWQEGLCFYRENRDASTNIFVTSLPNGTYRLSYEMYANNAGDFASGLATIQSQYAPQFSAHSSGTRLTVSQSDQSDQSDQVGPVRP
ncbi:MAG: hypothetical protein NC336_05715 [Clostridium sp.]|nr:hypothetical protein [Clostridium sp.]